MQKTSRELAAELEAHIIEFDRVTRGLFKPSDEQCISEQPTSAKRSARIYWLNDYRGMLH